MLAVADLDRDELMALALGLGAGEISDAQLRAARVGGAKIVEERALGAWRLASGRAATDAHAARVWAENHGYDDRFRALFEISKGSTAQAGALWKAYLKAHASRKRIERETRIAGC